MLLFIYTEVEKLLAKNLLDTDINSFTMEPEEFVATELDNTILKPTFGTFDLETTKWIEPICCGFYDGKKYYDFWGENSLTQFFDLLFKINYSGKIFAHAGGRFDSLFAIEEAYERGILKDCEMIIASGSLMKLTVTYEDRLSTNKKQKKISFVDSFDLTRASLKKLSKEFKIEHKKGNLDRTKMETYTKAEIAPYLKNDVLGLHEIMIIYYNKILNLTNDFPYLTIGSTAINSFMKKCPYQFEVLNNDMVDLFIRQTYKGGRVEVFKTYGKNLYYYDINSLYPSQMINKNMPIGKYIKVSKYTNIENYFNDFCGFGKFEIKSTPDLYIPFLSYRYDGKLVFPNGSFTGYYTFSEIEKALDLGYEVKFLGGYVSKAVKDLFDDWVLDLYKKRMINKKLGNDAMVLIIKLLLNNLYGKFGERKEHEEFLTNVELSKEDWLSNEITIYMDEPELYLRNVVFDRNYHNVGIASQITAYSRSRLYNFIDKIISMGYSVYYTDTDSIITDCPPSKLNIDNYKLGELKLENLLKEGVFIAPKLYGFQRNQDTNINIILNNDKITDKNMLSPINPIKIDFSVNNRLQEIKNKKYKMVHKGFSNLGCSYPELKEHYFNNTLKEIHYDDTSICKIKESLKRVNTLNRSGPFLSSKNVHKSLKSTYDKRIVLENMIDTLPLTFKKDILVA